MPVTSLTSEHMTSRVVTAPTRNKRYNILDKKIKGLAVRIHPNVRKFWFVKLKNVTKP